MSVNQETQKELAWKDQLKQLDKEKDLQEANKRQLEREQDDLDWYTNQEQAFYASVLDLEQTEQMRHTLQEVMDEVQAITGNMYRRMDDELDQLQKKAKQLSDQEERIYQERRTQRTEGGESK